MLEIYFSLTLYHTILTFNIPQKGDFWKHWAKKRKCWWSAFSLFRPMFSVSSRTNTIIWNTHESLSLDMSKNFYGKGLKKSSPISYQWLCSFCFRFNGQPVHGAQAVVDIHYRACYELFPDVLLVRDRNVILLFNIFPYLFYTIYTI